MSNFTPPNGLPKARGGIPHQLKPYGRAQPDASDASRVLNPVSYMAHHQQALNTDRSSNAPSAIDTKGDPRGDENHWQSTWPSDHNDQHAGASNQLSDQFEHLLQQQPSQAGLADPFTLQSGTPHPYYGGEPHTRPAQSGNFAEPAPQGGTQYDLSGNELGWSDLPFDPRLLQFPFDPRLSHSDEDAFQAGLGGPRQPPSQAEYQAQHPFRSTEGAVNENYESQHPDILDTPIMDTQSTQTSFMQSDAPSASQITYNSWNQQQLPSRSMKRPYSADETPTPTAKMPKIARPKLDMQKFVQVKTAGDAVLAFSNTLVLSGIILNAPAYVDEATSIQAAKLRLSRNAGTVVYHKFNIVSDDYNLISHQDLMPRVFQRFLDAILKKPGAAPPYITAAQMFNFTKKHETRYKLCCSQLSSVEQEGDATAAFELLADAAKRLSIHGIPVADLLASEYEKTGAKQKIMTKSKLLVDQDSTFLQRLDRMVEFCGVNKWFAYDVLNSQNTSDIAATPDAYSKQKYTAFISNDNRDSRREDSVQAKALVAHFEDQGGNEQGGGGFDMF